LSGVARVVDWDDTMPLADFHCPLMSLPFAFGTLVETIPARVPYLTADPARTARWRERLGEHAGLKIGLVWAGQPVADRVDERRPMALEHMLGLHAVHDVTLVSLHKGEGVGQASAAGAGPRLIDWTDELADFADTAALVAALDLVISVDTSVAHLAGGLAKP